MVVARIGDVAEVVGATAGDKTEAGEAAITTTVVGIVEARVAVATMIEEVVAVVITNAADLADAEVHLAADAK